MFAISPLRATTVTDLGSSVASESAPEFIVRSPVSSFDKGGYRAHVYLRWLQKDYEIQDRPIRLAATTEIVRVRVKVTLPYQSLFIAIPNKLKHDLQWWVNFDSQTAPPDLVQQLRTEVRQSYQERTKESAATDFTLRQLETDHFNFQIESLAIDPSSQGLARLRSIAKNSIEKGTLNPAGPVYGGLHDDLNDEPLISATSHFDKLMPITKGSIRDLNVNQMWIDRRGNYVAILSAKDTATTAHYTGRHPFYFGNLDKPEMYQFYSKSEHSIFSKCQYNVLKLEVFASTATEPGRIITVQLEPDGMLRISAPNDSTCLNEATPTQRNLLSERLKTGQAVIQNMPETREIISIYKMEGSENIYFYVDALARSHFPESYQMFMGEPGKLKPIEIMQVHQIESATGGAIIYTPAGTLHAPANYGHQSRPYWEDSAGTKTYLLPVVVKPRSEIVPFLQKLGVDLNRLREKPYQSPCEYLLRKAPVLKLVI